MEYSAPIAIFAFNRPDHLRRTLKALAANKLADRSHVTFFCDGPRDPALYPDDTPKCMAVREIAHNAQGFASIEVVEREQNFGCGKAVSAGLMQMFARHERLIVIEDDILTSPHTLAFLNEGLQRYEHDKRVFNIAAWSFPPHLLQRPKNYEYDVYCVPRFNCWGWASWSDRFQGFDWVVKNFFDMQKDVNRQRAFCAGGDDMYPMLAAQVGGEIDTWDIQTDWWRFCHGQLGLNPLLSYTTNIGMGSGTHTTEENHSLDNDVSLALPVKDICWLGSVDLDATIVRQYKSNYTSENGLVRFLLRAVRATLAMLGLLPFAKAVKKAFFPRV